MKAAPVSARAPAERPGLHGPRAATATTASPQQRGDFNRVLEHYRRRSAASDAVPRDSDSQSCPAVDAAGRDASTDQTSSERQTPVAGNCGQNEQHAAVSGPCGAPAAAPEVIAAARAVLLLRRAVLGLSTPRSSAEEAETRVTLRYGLLAGLQLMVTRAPGRRLRIEDRGGRLAALNLAAEALARRLRVALPGWSVEVIVDAGSAAQG